MDHMPGADGCRDVAPQSARLLPLFDQVLKESAVGVVMIYQGFANFQVAAIDQCLIDNAEFPSMAPGHFRVSATNVTQRSDRIRFPGDQLVERCHHLSDDLVEQRAQQCALGRKMPIENRFRDSNPTSHLRGGHARIPLL